MNPLNNIVEEISSLVGLSYSQALKTLTTNQWHAA